MIGPMAKTGSKRARPAPKDPEIAALDSAVRALTRQLNAAPPREAGRVAAALGEVSARLVRAQEARRAHDKREEDFDGFCRWQEAEIRDEAETRLRQSLDEALSLHPGDASAALQHLRAEFSDPPQPDADADDLPEPRAAVAEAGRRYGMDG